MNDDILMNARKIQNKLLADKQTKAGLKRAYKLIDVLMDAVYTASVEKNVTDQIIERLIAEKHNAQEIK